MDGRIPLSPTAAVPLGPADTWQRTLNRVIPAIVVIRVNSVRAFDGNGASFSYATGFIVDKERGIIITNRHVVTPGPVTADAILLNKEEAELKPIYRDPVHDFGFYTFDPKCIRFLDLTEIEMAPEDAKVGAEIRVVGNDAGEKLSILPGILARLDREAPNYGPHEYSDFNTFYYAAASSTSGGSSGSPVLNVNGRAIAINAGGAKKAASSFYLPLDRAVRALRLIQRGEPVPRGTLQVVFRHSAFDEVRRLGLLPETEEDVRKALPKETGMLVVDQVVPGGPANDKLQPGDVVVRLAGKLCTIFLPFEEYVDENVGEQLEIEVQRGGTLMKFTFLIQDLHSITPACFLEISGGVLHPLSYHQAKNNSLPVGSVFMAQSGYMLTKAGVTHQCIITSVDGEPTPDIETFERVFSALPDRATTTLRYFHLRDRHRIRTAVITVDRRWFPMQMCRRNDSDGLWHATPSHKPSSDTETASPPEFAPRALGTGRGLLVERMLRSLVIVSFDIPYLIDGLSSGSHYGVGIVVDAKRGLVVVDRNTVPIALGDVMVTFAASVDVPGEVVFIHPVHNIAVVSYDPALIGETVVDSAPLNPKGLEVGETVQFVGLSHHFSVVCQTTNVTKTDRLAFRELHPPQYRAINVEVVHFDRITKALGGIFMDDNGAVTALWVSFNYQEGSERKELYRGLPVELIHDLVNTFRRGETPTVRQLCIELLPVQISKARSAMGLSEEWIQKLEEVNEERRQVLSVRRTMAGTDAASRLKNGDLLLAVEGRTVVTFRDVERATEGLQRVTVKILRDREVCMEEVQLHALSTIGTDRVVLWSGLMLQEPHYAVRMLGYLPKEGGGVYCSRWCYGSPAHKYGLRATIWIVEVNGQVVKTLDDFLEVVRKLGHGEFVRLKTRDLNTKTKVFTLKTDYHYWATEELQRCGTSWKFRAIGSNGGEAVSKM